MAHILMLVCLITSLHVCAKDHGIRGHIFQIEEEDFIEYLQRKLNSMNPEEISTLKERISSHYASKLAQPEPVKGVKKAVEYSAWYFDPTVVAKMDIMDEKERVIVHKGDAYNPLKHTKLPQNLLIFDGEDPEQVTWAESKEGSWVWVNGHPLEAEKREGRPIYFDQFGFLCKKLNIQSIPAQVSQEGERIKIESFPMEAICK